MHKPASMLLALMGVGIVAYSISLDGRSKQQPPTERTIEVARALALSQLFSQLQLSSRFPVLKHLLGIASITNRLSWYLMMLSR